MGWDDLRSVRGRVELKVKSSLKMVQPSPPFPLILEGLVNVSFQKNLNPCRLSFEKTGGETMIRECFVCAEAAMELGIYRRHA